MKKPTGHAIVGTILIWVSCGTQGSAQETVSEPNAWRAFCRQLDAGGPPELPDFSYAGYRHGEQGITPVGPVLNVGDYGAVPDDASDDLEAIKRAVRAAQKMGGGIIRFPAGRFLVNTDMANRGAVPIDSDNIVFRGAGCGAGGTIVHMIHPYGGGNPQDYRRLHLGRNLLSFFSRPEATPIGSRPVVARIVADAQRETFVLHVDDASRLSVGDRVALHCHNSDLVREMVKPYEIEPSWTRIGEGRAYVAEMHVIAAIDGNRVAFAEPIRYDISARFGWDLRPFRPIVGVGVEDICFMGNAYHRYVHHRSGYDDSGWAFIKFRGVADSWIRRCSFVNVSQSVAVTLSASVSVLNLRIEGNRGHHTPRTYFYSSGVLNGLIADNAGFDHGPSVSFGAVGTVFWRTRGASPVDCHSGAPYVTLFDRVAAAGFRSSGGLRDYPQHLRHMVLWNFENLEDGHPTYDFWRPGQNNRFVKPWVIGLTGQPIGFEDGSLGKLESPDGEAVPSSLYEAQLTRRQGHRPEWLDEALGDAETMATLSMPDHYRRDGGGTAFTYVETFKVADLLRYVTTLSLQMYDSKLFQFSLVDPELSITTDQGFLRNALYSLMSHIYDHCRTGNTLGVRLDEESGDILFLIRSGKPIPGNEPTSAKVQDAIGYAKIIGGTVETGAAGSPFIIRLPRTRR